MSEHKVFRRVKQVGYAIDRFITFCLYGNQNPEKSIEARQLRAERLYQINPEDEHLRNHIRTDLH